MIRVTIRIIRYNDYKIISDREINNKFDFYIEGCISDLKLCITVKEKRDLF